MVIGAKVVSAFLMSGLMTLNVPSRVTTSTHRPGPVLLVQATPQKSPNGGNHSAQTNGHKMGDWLQAHNSLPLEKRTQALQRMEFLSKLSPQQRQQLRDANQQLKGLPPERQVAVHTALRHLRQMPSAERQQVIQSDRFRSTFSDQEQKLISELAEMNPPEGGSAQSAQPK